MNKAVFLDRDGVINRDNPNYTYTIDDFHFNEGIFESLKAIIKKGYHLIIITNQSGINKKIYDHKEVTEVHNYLLEKFRKESISILEIYYCPHHPSVGNCICRKPDSLLIEKALARFHISPALSYFIGDRERDMQAAAKAGIAQIFVEENANLNSILHLIQ